jgi:type II secretory pathway component GspD/PulD (secretin)
MNHDLMESRKMKFGYGVLGAILVVALIGPNALGQTANNAPGEKEQATLRQDNANSRVDSRPYQVFYLTNATQVNDANEIVVAIRNLLEPQVKIFLVPNQNAITMRGTPEQLALAQKIINDLDRPRKSYRLTYSITELDGGKRVGVQHFSMIVTSGQRTQVKQGSRVPIVTESDKDNTQVQYIDIGLNFDSTLDQYGSGAKLSTKVEQTSVAEEKSGVVPQDPVVRQTMIANTSFLLPGKPAVLGSLDVAGSTRHLDIDVMMEPIVP